MSRLLFVVHHSTTQLASTCSVAKCNVHTRICLLPLGGIILTHSQRCCTEHYMCVSKLLNSPSYFIPSTKSIVSPCIAGCCSLTSKTPPTTLLSISIAVSMAEKSPHTTSTLRVAWQTGRTRRRCVRSHRKRRWCGRSLRIVEDGHGRQKVVAFTLVN